jgi:D-3-phosphoglycerate dehydrogenase
MSAIIAGGEYLTEAVLSQLPELRVIARAGVGYDRVDVPAATRRKVALTITPNANHECVAEQAMAMLMAVTRQIVPHHLGVSKGDWTRLPMVPLRGKTLGLVGLGRIGRSMAVRAAAFRMRLVACEKYPDQEFVKKYGIQLMEFPELLAQSDYVTIHAPLNDETRGLFNCEAFAKMKAGSYLVNTARGGLVVEKDLIEALRSKHLAGAALDVFEQEPTPADNPLLKFQNVVFAPHIAGGDYQSNEDMALECAQNIVALHRGEWPVGSVVNTDLRETWKW